MEWMSFTFVPKQTPWIESIYSVSYGMIVTPCFNYNGLNVLMSPYVWRLLCMVNNYFGKVWGIMPKMRV